MNEVPTHVPGTPTKRPRRWLLVVSLSFLLMAAGLSAYLYHFRDPVTRSNFNRIAEGMTADEVHALLSRRPDHVGSTKWMEPPDTPWQVGRLRKCKHLQWDSSELTIVVVIDDETNRVIDHFEVEAQIQPWYIRWFNGVKAWARL